MIPEHIGKCLEGEFKCLSGNECIQIALVHDGIYHCSDKSDESSLDCMFYFIHSSSAWMSVVY